MSHSARRILPDAEALAREAARWLTETARARLAAGPDAPGHFSIALSGGTTPRRLYELLATPEFRDVFPWDRTHLFWGDERLVPSNDPTSNYRMARAALLDHVPIPPAQVHPVRVMDTPAETAATYQAELARFYCSDTLDMERPLFDVVLLGLGKDGHTASLFPGSPALDESLAWVVPVIDAVPQPRVSLTYPAIACSNTVAFLVSGGNKRDVLQRVLAGDRTLPAARVAAIGEIHWFMDRDAAG
ncbi:MAG TPA: 6-phosphogluconolactonase [Acetobacteraceae bacterium]|nr:6-phosphogluconolactonase [Acetobacteraceae bacterium]